MEPIQLCVFDFDGTLTDIRDGHPEFDARYRDVIAGVVGRDVATEWEALKTRIQAESPERAWLLGGATAPAAADPYTLATEAGREILRAAGVPEGHHGDILGLAHFEAYGAAAWRFRSDAAAVLTVAANRVPTYVVTNSSTAKVTERLTAKVFPQGLGKLSVEGDARKFVVGAPAVALPFPAQRTFPGLTRPVQLYRPFYEQRLRTLWQATGARPENTLVVGDIFELDLALPAELGARVHLVERVQGYEYERRAIDALGARGSRSPTLLPVLQRLGR